MHTVLCTALSPEKLPKEVSCGFAWPARDAGGKAQDLNPGYFPHWQESVKEAGDDLSTNNNESA